MKEDRLPFGLGIYELSYRYNYLISGSLKDQHPRTKPRVDSALKRKKRLELLRSRIRATLQKPVSEVLTDILSKQVPAPGQDAYLFLGFCYVRCNDNSGYAREKGIEYEIYECEYGVELYKNKPRFQIGGKFDGHFLNANEFFKALTTDNTNILSPASYQRSLELQLKEGIDNLKKPAQTK